MTDPVTMGSAFGAAGTVVGAVAGIASGIMGSRGARKRRQAARLRARITAMENASTYRDTLRSFRQQRAGAVASSTAMPTGGFLGSNVGMISSLGSQTTAATNIMGRSDFLNTRANRLERRADQLMSRAALVGSLGQTATAFGSALGGPERLAQKMGVS